MRTQSTIITTLAIAAALALPVSAASGSPLLSGYGGPGAGEQQLVSGGLVGGGGSGSGRGGGPGASTPTASATEGQLSQSNPAAGSGAGGRNGGKGTAGSGRTESARSGQAGRAGQAPHGGRSSSPTRNGSRPHVHEVGHTATAVPSSALGLSGGQLLLAAIIAAALLLTALATRRLAGLKLREESVDRRLMNAGKGH